MIAAAGQEPFRLIVAGGGTGGHLFPGVAVAEELRRREPDAGILFVGTGRPVEAAVLEPRGLPHRSIIAAGIKGLGLLGRIKSLARIPVGLAQSLAIIMDFKPHLVLGVGGYVSGPVVLAARILGKPAALQEQNSIPGLTNRLLSRIADAVFISFEASRRYFAGTKTHLTGNPIRREIAEASAAGRLPRREGFTLLIAGGSQGAHAVNTAAVGAVRILNEKLPRLTVIHQTGAADEQEVREAYVGMGVHAETLAFVHDMEQAYRRADLAVCRAGALTVAEVAAMGLPAVFIPLPTAADNHQEINARSLVEAGAGEMILQAGLSPEILADCIHDLAASPERLREMSEAARAAARPDAAAAICDICLKLAGRPEEGAA